MLHQQDAISKRLDDLAAADADMLTDAALGWELIRQMEQAGKETSITEMRMLCIGHIHNGGEIIIDGYAPGALYAETERRPGMGDPLTADEVAELMADAPADFFAGLEDVANGAHYCADDIDWTAVEDERIGD